MKLTVEMTPTQLGVELRGALGVHDFTEMLVAFLDRPDLRGPNDLRSLDVARHMGSVLAKNKWRNTNGAVEAFFRGMQDGRPA